MIVFTTGFVVVAVVVAMIIAIAFRKVVPPNSVHVVQSSKKTVSYGKDMKDGNVYYKWPFFLPILGVQTVELPVSVFDLSFEGYTAYDKDKVPFDVDITAFFMISDPNTAAQKVSSISELQDQLRAVVQGAVRTTLAKSDIEQIMLERSVFGTQFTTEVEEGLKSWGVSTVKSIELMDIRDAEGSKVIINIQEKKKSNIEMESRKEVAKNNQDAEMAEIKARKEVDLEAQIAKELVGKRTVEADEKVALANEAKEQTVKAQQKITKEKEMDVLKVETVKRAEIQKEATIVKENEEKEARVIKAEADLAVETKNKESEVVKSEGLLKAKENEAKGIQAEGDARAKAKKEMELAEVTAQVTLADKIGENKGYQEYLVSIKRVEAEKEVGMEQAKALQKAEVKIISNTDSPTSGLNSVSELFSSKGGTQTGAMLEGLSHTPLGKKLLETMGVADEDKKPTAPSKP